MHNRPLASQLMCLFVELTPIMEHSNTSLYLKNSIRIFVEYCKLTILPHESALNRTLVTWCFAFDASIWLCLNKPKLYIWIYMCVCVCTVLSSDSFCTWNWTDNWFEIKFVCSLYTLYIFYSVLKRSIYLCVSIIYIYILYIYIAITYCIDITQSYRKNKCNMNFNLFNLIFVISLFGISFNLTIYQHTHQWQKTLTTTITIMILFHSVQASACVIRIWLFLFSLANLFLLLLFYLASFTQWSNKLCYQEWDRLALVQSS